jgi:hypothetical protein
MKLSLFVALLLPFSVYASELASARLHSYQTISLGGERKASGFLQYVGQHRGREVVALSADIGSAIPTEDLRLYVRDGDRYRLLIEIPMLHHHGFRCTASGDILRIYLTRSYGSASKEEEKSCITLDLDALVLATIKA